MSVLKRVCFLGVAAALAASLTAFTGGAQSRARPAELVEVIVLLDQPPLARSGSLARVRSVSDSQRDVEATLAERIPGSRVFRRYRIVLNGLAVGVPGSKVGALRELPGVRAVYPSVRYRTTLHTSPGFIGAPALWGRALESAGNGVKIGVIDDGVDQSHPFFSGRGYRFPRGYPKGQRRFTTAKVIVARAFAPRGTAWRFARRPFDPALSGHATHVAGIAAGNYRTSTGAGRVSGVAPKAYIGNYKVLTVPTPGFGLNGNSPEIVAGIEAAVKDGMDVINLSIGEAEIEPSRDLVALALDGAAAAGVIPVVAAGNDFPELGIGSVTSPGSSARAITVAAESTSGPAIADFSSGGPTPQSLRFKPDVTAPGVGVLSSVPRRERFWASLSGTSMAAPHVAGAVALLRQRHRTWTVGQVKSALVQTGDPVLVTSRAGEVGPTRQGGGSVNLVRADAPLLFAEPSGVSLGFVLGGGTAAQRVALSDAGGGAGVWTAGVNPHSMPAGASVTTSPAVTVPGEVAVAVSAAPGAAQGEGSGFVVLTRGAERRRIPYWFRTVAPALGQHQRRLLTRTGTYRGDTRGRPAIVESYRYPDDPRELGIPRVLRGPEQVFRVRLARPVANFGVAIISRRGGVEPRIVRAGDENRLLGSVALPFNANPYVRRYGERMPVSGATRPAPGEYDLVFDSALRSGGRFTFRFWIGDTARPRLRLARRTVPRGGRLLISAVDLGSGVDPRSIQVRVDGRLRSARYDPRRRLIVAGLRGVRPGRHRVRAIVSDYQESKNTENVGRILPNTALLRAVVRVR
jgi:subtilisin family serine protease